jgi:hypothetical protein
MNLVDHSAALVSASKWLVASSLLLCLCRKPVPEFTKALDEITAGDITKLVTNMLKAPPSFAGSGNISAMPRYDALLRRFS